jgi:hypothetical protein
MMNKYYSLTDGSIAFQIAINMSTPLTLILLLTVDIADFIGMTVLHPHYKASYFVKAGWET